MNFTIKGAYGETNFGDDLLMCVFENYFKKEFPDSELNFEGKEAVYPQKLLNTSSRYMEPSFQPDWLVYGGGTQFFSFKQRKFNILLNILKIAMNNPKRVIRKLSLNHNRVLDIKHKAFLGFGIGPFNNDLKAEFAAKKRLKEADFIGVRDEISYKYCHKWGLDCSLGADAVYSSYSPITKKVYTQVKHHESLLPKKIGIIVRDWAWEKTGNEYANRLYSFYKNDKSNSYKFIIFAPEKDKQWLKKIKYDEKLIWDPNKFDIISFSEELAKFDAFISARFHGAIMASLLHKPVICIEIEPKLTILTKQFQEMKLWRKPFHIEELSNYVNNLNYDIRYDYPILTLQKEADEMFAKFTYIIRNETKSSFLFT